MKTLAATSRLSKRFSTWWTKAIPAAIGYQVAGGYRMMIGLAVLSAVVAAVAGLFISYFLNVAAGATIVLTLTVLFSLALACKRPATHGPRPAA